MATLEHSDEIANVTIHCLVIFNNMDASEYSDGIANIIMIRQFCILNNMAELKYSDRITHKAITVQ